MYVSGVRGRACIGVGLALAALAAGCGGSDDGEDARPLPLDERAGTFRGIGFGDSPADIRRVFGRPTPYSQTEGSMPLGDDFYDVGGPTTSEFPPEARKPGRSTEPGVMRYRGVTFSTYSGEVYELFVTAEGARTREGVRIGDDLDEAESAYPQLDCDTAYENSEYPEYPYCTGRVARARYVWFGEDPIRSIVISKYPFGR